MKAFPTNFDTAYKREVRKFLAFAARGAHKAYAPFVDINFSTESALPTTSVIDIPIDAPLREFCSTLGASPADLINMPPDLLGGTMQVTGSYISGIAHSMTMPTFHKDMADLLDRIEERKELRGPKIYDHDDIQMLRQGHRFRLVSEGHGFGLVVCVNRVHLENVPFLALMCAFFGRMLSKGLGRPMMGMRIMMTNVYLANSFRGIMEEGTMAGHKPKIMDAEATSFLTRPSISDFTVTRKPQL